MPDLDFTVESAAPVEHAASPALQLALRITDKNAESIHSVALRCQIMIEPARRKYSAAEEEQLRDLFGEVSRWGQTLRPMLWTNTSIIVPPFDRTTLVQLPVPCSYDFNIAAAKYFYALAEGEVPLCLLFSGTVFFAGEDGALQIAQIPWTKETNFRLSVRTWREMMEMYYPNSAFLCLRKDAFDRLYQFKMQHGLSSWEAAIDKLLAEINEQVTA